VDLNTNHFIMTNKVAYPEMIAFMSTNFPSASGSLPGFTLPESEVYLNHVHTEPHTLLMGLKYTDTKTGVTYMQEHSGWIKPAGKGWVVYLMPGHTKHDFENAAYGRIVVNAVIYQP
jgi:type 1 glutamine amidotransferase